MCINLSDKTTAAASADNHNNSSSSSNEQSGFSDAHCHIFPYIAAPGAQNIMVPPSETLTPSTTLEAIRDMVHRTRTAAAIMSTDLGDMATVDALQRLMQENATTTIADLGQGRIVPAFGVHPWYSYKYYIPTTAEDEEDNDDDAKAEVPTLTGAAKAAHYAAVLSPAPDAAFVAALPDPISFYTVLRELETHLVEFPEAIVGECGLDKIFRIQNPFYSAATADRDGRDPTDSKPQQQQPKLSKHVVKMAHQTALLRLQLELAARHARPISVHCVKAPTALLDLVRAMVITPPALCLHSYTGSVEYLVNNWYAAEKKKTTPAAKSQKRQQQQEKAAAAKPTNNDNNTNATDNPAAAITFPRVYVSLSTLFNNDARHATTFKDLVRAIPPDRLLLESDHYIGEHGWAQMNQAVATSVAAALDLSVATVLVQTRQNFDHFCRVSLP
jgi:Tat protein secretion system quality control protein TatD with DNase activity